MNRIKSILAIALTMLIVFSGVSPTSMSVMAKKSSSGGKSITLNYSQYTLKKGKKVKLKATTSSKKKSVVFKSKNPKVATVDSKGNVKAAKKGKTVITATIKGTKKSAKCTIYVGSPVSIVSIGDQQIELNAGQNYQVTARVEPLDASIKTVSFKSSDESVASVSESGLVVAKGEGTATITATANDGSKKSASLLVKVNGATQNGKDSKDSKDSKDANNTNNTNGTNGSGESGNSGGSSESTIGSASKNSGLVTLTASSNSVVAGTTDNKVYLYATVAVNVDKVELYDSNGNFVKAMEDDGVYKDSGDDMKGDQIYSAYKRFVSGNNGRYSYYVKAYVGSEEITSDTVDIDVVSVMSDENREEMTAADNAIEEVTETLNPNATIEVKKTAVQNVLNEQKNSGNIKSVGTFDSESNVITFEYTDGTTGAVSLEENTIKSNGTGKVRNPKGSGLWDTMIKSESLAPIARNSSNTAGSIGKAIIYFGFSGSNEVGWRKAYYNDEAIPELNGMGLTTTMKEATLKDFKAMSAYDVIVFSMHGSSYGNDLYMCTYEKVSAEKDNAYYADLINGRVVRATLIDGNTYYWVKPAFFTANLGATSLNGKVLFSETCDFMGEGSKVSTQFSSALLGRGASTVVGFHNSVLAVYSRELMKAFVTGLASGKTTGDAFASATATYGVNDGHGAYPILSGSTNTVLFTDDFKNGSFELTPVLTEWYHLGDARTITGLAELSPTHGKKMAILTTGIGSSSSSYDTQKNEGTEGSVLSQTFVVPSDASTLSFTYNVVSEEPLEYVNTEFDDKFIARLLDTNGNLIVELAREEVNTSTWYEIFNIDFDDGDDTVYHTKWKDVSYDLSSLRNQRVTLEFVTFDEGDSVFDTVGIIDNVVVK
ncbi:Ig-like domain-containing protein [Butyrivibrio sp. INlla16]|uniref:Ig-like domain-containing protein n=1 Tax=Butyrivibrio sp. INlla16 TaxID=1520807 RepID=UPI0008899AFB|nr:Ig-like domain-containing protein [Butyrivibrio sp. INlla16]SDB07054.1 Ig-like domain (group 2) [Butyrivibrio sp. INlla16]